MKKKSIIIMNQAQLHNVYGENELTQIETLTDRVPGFYTAQSINENPSLLKDVEIIFSSWGMPTVDESFLKNAPKLEAIFYSAGSVKGFVTDALWERGVVVTSAYSANAIPVAEYCVSMIQLSLKRALPSIRAISNKKNWVEKEKVNGAYGSTVGLVSLGKIGQHVLKLLKNYDLNILVNTMNMSAERAKELGVELCNLEEIFKRSDVISIHTANVPETQGMITGAHFRSMKQGATFINSARGAVVKEKEMLAVLKDRPDLSAILDVTNPEPPEVGSIIYELPNVFLTPHIAGSMDTECRRMAGYSIEECKRYLNGEPLVNGVTKEMLKTMA